MPIGNLTAFLTYIFADPALGDDGGDGRDTLAARPRRVPERVQEVLLTVPVVSDPAQPVRPSLASGVVTFDGVSFEYPGSERPVVEELSSPSSPARRVRSLAARVVARRRC